MDLAFDIFPAATPRGTRLVRLTGQQLLAGSLFRKELGGLGGGRIVINAHQAEATPANFARDNYVEVFDLNLSGAYSLGAFFLEEGDFEAVSRDEQAGRILSFSGSGELGYLSRGILGTQALSGASGPFDQHYIDTTGQWDWGSDPATETYGAILRRIIYESALMTPDPLPEVQLVDINWDDLVDSNGDTWAPFLGRYTIPVGENLLQAVADLSKHGIELIANADFEYFAYNAGGYGTDRTSGTFATNKVRFEHGINIAADLKRAVHGAAEASHAIVVDKTGTLFETVTAPGYSGGDTVRYVGLRASGDSQSEDDLELLGTTVLTNRATYVDQFRFPHPSGYDELDGIYTPGPPVSAGHYWVGDYVTIHTGTGPHDANERTIRVAAIEWSADEAGNWLPTVELGSKYLSANAASLDARMASLVNAAHTHPPNPELCRIGVPAEALRLYFSDSGTHPTVTRDAAWSRGHGQNGMSVINGLLTTSPGNTVDGSASWSTGSSTPPFNFHHGQHFYELSGAGTLSGRVRAMLNALHGSTSYQSQLVVRIVSADGATVRGTLLAAHNPGSLDSTNWLTTYHARRFPASSQWDGDDGALMTPVAYEDGDWVVVETGVRFLAGSTGPGAAIQYDDGNASDIPIDESSADTELNSWIEFVTPELGGDVPQPVQTLAETGTSIRAARCDHVHDHSDIDYDGSTDHDARSVSYDGTTSGLTATDVQDAIDEVAAAGGGGGTLTVEEEDGTPSESPVDKIQVPNGTLTVDSAGVVSLAYATIGHSHGGSGVPVPDLLNSLKGSADTPDAEFSGTISPFAAIDGTSGTVSLNAAAGAGLYDTSSRSGWVLMQVGPAVGDSVELKQDYTLPDGKCIVAYLSFAVDQAGTLSANNEIHIGIGVNDNDTGPSAGTAAQTLQAHLDTDASGAVRVITFDGSVVPGEMPGSNVAVSGWFMRIDRSGLVYRGFASLDGFAWSYIGTKTMGTAANNVWLFARCGATMATRIVVGCPWFRQGTALAVDPWPL